MIGSEGGDRSARVNIPDGRGVQVGDGNMQVNIFGREDLGQEGPTSTRAECVVVGDVPQEPPAFQPRPDRVAVLEATGGPRVSVVFAVTGIRGVGKTQVAAAYARRRIVNRWRLVAWLDASEEVSILAGLARVAVAAGVGKPGEDPRELATSVRHWLEADGKRRLVVFDNASDLDVLRPFLPAAGASQVVITSSRQSVTHLGMPVPVDVFTEEEALAFLVDRTRIDDGAGARELAAELGCLPLGLAQAAATIARERLDYGTYLGRLRAIPVSNYLIRVEGDPYPHGVAKSILLSLKSIEDADSEGLCARVMDLVSFLSDAGVSRTLLYGPVDAGVLPCWNDGGRVPMSEVSPVSLDAALGRLADASLIAFGLDGSAVSAHRLVARVVRERRIADGEVRAVAVTAIRLLAGAVERVRSSRTRASVLALQIGALNEHVTNHLSDSSAEVKQSLLRLRVLSVGLVNTYDSAYAIHIGTPLVTECERILGADHPDTLTCRKNLADAYHSSWNPGDAIPLYERTLADRERVLGFEHPDTIVSRYDLAVAYNQAGQVREAIPLYERTLADRERVLGFEHPDTIILRNDLAYAYLSARRLGDAIVLYEHILADLERIQDIDRPTIDTVRNNLGYAYTEAGQPEKAIPLLERNLADSGDKEPDATSARLNLIHAYHEAGRHNETIPLYETAVAGGERVLGGEHANTLGYRYNLAVAFRLAGRLEEAMLLHERTVADRERILGMDHPDTLSSRNSLADTYMDAGRAGQAIPLYERTMVDRERILYSDHPDTLSSRHDLATAYKETGQTGEAIRLYERTLADRERILGGDHLSVLVSRISLASAYELAGRQDEAIAVYERALADCERVLGPDDSLTQALSVKLS
jgi:tetratricopeptide (TPR) repeat protein